MNEVCGIPTAVSPVEDPTTHSVSTIFTPIISCLKVFICSIEVARAHLVVEVKFVGISVFIISTTARHRVAFSSTSHLVSETYAIIITSVNIGLPVSAKGKTVEVSCFDEIAVTIWSSCNACVIRVLTTTPTNIETIVSSNCSAQLSDTGDIIAHQAQFY